MLTRILYTVLSIPVILLILHTLIRVIRHFYKFPMPQWMANAIDNPFRRRIQPPEETAIRHGIQPGMRVLEVGPGNGTYTLGASRQVEGIPPGVTTLGNPGFLRASHGPRLSFGRCSHSQSPGKRILSEREDRQFLLLHLDFWERVTRFGIK